MRVMMSVLALAMLCFASDAVSAQGVYPAFCQGIAADDTGNRMFLSRTFGYPQTSPPAGGMLTQGSAGVEFAREVKRRSNVVLVDYSCFTRPTADEIDALAQQTLTTNQGSWTVDVIDWAPKGAVAVGGAVAATDAPGPIGSTGAGPTPAADARAAAAERAAARRAAEAARVAAEQAAAAERAAAAARDAAEQVRTLNAAQAATAAAQAQKIVADKKAFQDQRAAYERAQRANIDQQAAYVTAKAKYEAEVRAAEAARQQWEADVIACKKGNSARCAPRSP